ncbi:alpha/beta hydrolase [Rhizobium sp. 60-20]|uniref:alpha/beta hydrolase family protein n=1 Tax=Rhizobium sp. 60-20 TaxID=1895819 RepID=UPI00092B52E9|nr:alpha/beta hydrolase [Rhizobium sp. 60-20]MBN8949856.1 alpha/beta hydrolase [Rhizobium tropici]OJY62761.1 MAG: alpha/beta hydrolase [Rhizobium sp. 60-20]
MRELVLAVLMLGATLGERPPPSESCPVGVYRLADGGIVDIDRSDGETLRWRRFDGATGSLAPQADGRWISSIGWTKRRDGNVVAFSRCDEGGIAFSGTPGSRIPLQVTNQMFQGTGVQLAGRLVMPAGDQAVPVVVLVHGAEQSSALDDYALQRILPAVGVGVFVYDKRGTGRSKGQYTQDFNLLADDAVAALQTARRLAGKRASRIGFQGGSQGGWVVPLAAARTTADFVIVSFGLAVSVIDEDREAVALEMRLKGHPPEDIAKALEIADAAEAVMESGLTGGFERFDVVRARYRLEPWYRDVHGNFTHLLLPYTSAELRERGAAYRFGTPFRYDPMPTLRALAVPQLWVLGADDLDAPSEETSRRLTTLIDAGRPITLAVYPGAEHGMTEYEAGPDGARVSTRYAEGYFAMLRDFALSGSIHGSYGRAHITHRRGSEE